MKDITKKVCKNLIKSLEKEVYLDGNHVCEFRKYYEPRRCFLNLTSTINFKRSNMYVALPSFTIHHPPKKFKKLTETISLKYQL